MIENRLSFLSICISMFYNIYILYFMLFQYSEFRRLLPSKNRLWIVKTLKPIMISCSIDFDRTFGHSGFEGVKADCTSTSYFAILKLIFYFRFEWLRKIDQKISPRARILLSFLIIYRSRLLTPTQNQCLHGFDLYSCQPMLNQWKVHSLH